MCPGPCRRPTTPVAEPERRSDIPAKMRSRIADLLRKAQATVNGVPADTDGDPVDDDRRAELAPVRGDWTPLATLASADRRVVKAFDATR